MAKAIHALALGVRQLTRYLTTDCKILRLHSFQNWSDDGEFWLYIDGVRFYSLD